ncbi:MAG: hypothetical protein COS39_03820 [Hydrogenophilales bacterium CG03_land_8_20_14_0_80_62_28]|nr:hypothetical protein [Betaproteobacteria bacterium]OIO77008.1 MAG: hypothetical protein AUJ86_10185 [Hydrogenophilaceae bacterium CG1_02_62_390]PIV23549.1 MAG: hypothetical protein COS39_03820 [Hydrogenophilales bacterium CG03_land_8_20_14_0_80_62_28]PIW39184.1 MAG: hypothetical protein COW23_02840 [Hydrogenophilales bacterium CG15_BIG_FIL_POST_REV_8_21_14_020_62_31]PIW72672.1 MAG: hypothetical protein COW07_01575 [Hydrogenophilales bacterium CG12_big_fil_rev_8_21_14_0_65_61_21]PIY97514.1 M
MTERFLLFGQGPIGLVNKLASRDGAILSQLDSGRRTDADSLDATAASGIRGAPLRQTSIRNLRL